MGRFNRTEKEKYREMDGYIRENEIDFGQKELFE